MRRVSCRTLRIFIVVTALASAFTWGQQPAARLNEPRSFLVQLGYTKAEYPYDVANTCIAVFPDGRFHLEKSWTQSVAVGSGVQIFEGALSEEDLRSLSAILAAEPLKLLTTDDRLRFGMSEGEIIRAVVPRPEGTQDFSLAGLAGSPMQTFKPLPAAVDPLVQWIRVTGKQIEKQKSFYLKDTHQVNCWLPKTPATNIASGPAVAKADGENIANGDKDETIIFDDSQKARNQPVPEIITDQTKLYADARTLTDLPVSELHKRFSELRGLKPAESQDELASLLASVGDKMEGLISKMPDLISHEDVIQKAPGFSPKRQQFDYLILFHRAQDFVTLKEYRVNLKTGLPVLSEAPASSTPNKSPTAWSDLPLRRDQTGTPKDGSTLLSQGFANMWVFFHPSNRSESQFRYLGRQNIDRHSTFVIAFVQKPGAVRLPGQLRVQDRFIPILYQGIAWIDEANFRIVRLRADLLSPLAAVQLQRLTADIHFEDTPVSGAASALWLPQEAIVTTEVQGQTSEERHRYSDYRLYRAQTKMLLGPF